jgi:hypothetical protein
LLLLDGVGNGNGRVNVSARTASADDNSFLRHNDSALNCSRKKPENRRLQYPIYARKIWVNRPA